MWTRPRAVTSKVKPTPWYEGENPGVKTNLVRLLMHGRLAGTGKLVILPVDQGYEHGPARSFAPNPAAYDPHYLFELAIEAGLSGYAAPLGPARAGCRHLCRAGAAHLEDEQRQQPRRRARRTRR